MQPVRCYGNLKLLNDNDESHAYRLAAFSLKGNPGDAHIHTPYHAYEVATFCCCNGILFIHTAGETQRFQTSF
jgi:hypothetical protein